MNARGAVSAVLLAMILAIALPPQVEAQQKGAVVVSVTELTATVEDIDRDNRVLTLKGPEGGTLDVKVGEQVENFDQINKGDEVSVEYLRSVALSLSKEAAPPAEFAQFTEVVPPGEKPAVIEAATLQVAATIEQINKDDREVTVRGPQGKTLILKADPDVDLNELKEGDQILATFTQAVAVSVKKTS